MAVAAASAEGRMPRAASGSAWRVAFVIFALMMSVSAFYSLFQGSVPDLANQKTSVPSNRDNLLYVGLWLGLYGISGLLVLKRIFTKGIELRLLLVVPFALYIVASAAWAQYPEASIMPAAMLCLNIVISAALAATMDPASLLRTMGRLNIVLVGISLAMLAIDPAAVISDPTRPGLLMPGQLFGAYGNKAALGTSACISILIVLYLPGVVEGPWLKTASLVLLALGVILSNSAGAISAGLVAGTTLLAARRLPRFSKIFFAVAATAAILWSVSLPFISVGALGELLGRSSDLTGRGTFWPMAPDFFLDRPFFGYGYLNFFNSGAYSRAWEIWERELFFYTPEFHNTFLDVSIGLGLIGVSAYLAVLATSASVFLHASLERRCAEVLAAILIVFIIGSATEFLLMAHNNQATIYLFYCFFTGGRRFSRTAPARVADFGAARHDPRAGVRSCPA